MNGTNNGTSSSVIVRAGGSQTTGVYSPNYCEYEKISIASNDSCLHAQAVAKRVREDEST